MADDLESTESLLKDTKLELMLSCRLAAALLSRRGTPGARHVGGKMRYPPWATAAREREVQKCPAPPDSNPREGTDVCSNATSMHPVMSITLLRSLSRPLSCCQAAGLLGLLCLELERLRWASASPAGYSGGGEKNTGVGEVDE